MNVTARDFDLRVLCSALVLAIAASASARAEDLPLLGLAHVELRVTDLEQARKFYHDLLGFEKPFEASRPEGTGEAVVFYKVNDRQFIELVAGIKADAAPLMTHIAMATDNVERLRALLVARGLAVGPIERSPRDGSRSCSLRTLPGQNLDALEFVEYGPDSLESQARGKALGLRRISQRLEHAGIIATDFAAARKFYIETLGFHEMWSRNQPDGTPVLNHLRLSGPSGDYIELSNKPKPISRAQAGTAAHISLEVLEIRAAQKEVLARAPDANLKEPRFGLDQRWQFNLFDPDGTRVELMQPRASSPN
jgi:lactoylglutathione lyase